MGVVSTSTDHSAVADAYEQHLAAGLGDAFDHVGGPDVFADRDPDPHAPKRDRAGHGAGLEHALLVENPVVRKIELVP